MKKLIEKKKSKLIYFLLGSWRSGWILHAFAKGKQDDIVQARWLEKKNALPKWNNNNLEAITRKKKEDDRMD